MIRTITSTLPLVHGGRTHALLRRIKFLEDEFGISNQQIITTNYNANYNEVYRSYLEQDKITKNLKIINIYDYICNGKLLNESRMKKIETKIEIDGYKSEEVPERNAFRYYSDGEYVLFRKYYDDTKIIQFEDVMSQACKHKIQRNEYNSFGILHRITHYSVEKNIKLHEEYYDVDSQKYMEKFYSDNNPNQVIGIQIYDSKSNVMYSFASENELFIWFFDEVLDDGDTIFNDARALDYGLLKSNKNTKNIMVIHANHHELAGDLKNSFKTMFNLKDNVYKYVVLTNEQKRDIVKESNVNPNKLIVIPHSLKKTKVKRDNVKDKFVYIGRIDPIKQLTHLIQAFAIFCEKNSDINLFIYGKGEESETTKIDDLVSELDIENRVYFKEYTDSPEKVFNESKASFLTSKSEGFGLTVLESLNAGCPVVAYDLNYGPSDLIQNGKNGILVEQNHIDNLANAMHDVLDKKYHHVENLYKFSMEAAKDNYKNLLNI